MSSLQVDSRTPHRAQRGEIRLSGFMRRQSAYSEFYFCDTHRPAFRNVDFLPAVRANQ